LTLAEGLPTFNAAMNASSAAALFTGYWAVRTRRVSLHWKCMAAAFGASALFLVGYLTRFALTGVHHYAGPWRTFYLALPLILRTMWLSAVRKAYPAHRKVARWTFPVWAYVSVTGVLVYWMLYRL